jgi:hypothetical protein
MAKFANVVTVEVSPGRRDQLLPLLMAHKARCLKEDGPCSTMTLHPIRSCPVPWLTTRRKGTTPSAGLRAIRS